MSLLEPVTIAMLTHNRSWHLAQTVASVRQFTRVPYRILLYDMHSNAEHLAHASRLAGDDCDIVRHPFSLSCLEGRRLLLDNVPTDFFVYLDDDIRVGPRWLSHMLTPMRADDKCAAVAANLCQEEQKLQSGVRYLQEAPNGLRVGMHEMGYLGQGDLCCGGATLYRTEAMRATEYREEFAGGYEDWDQTLQLRENGWNIYGSRATLFHKHMPESADRDYFKTRWRWTELAEAAIGMWDRWKIRTAADKVLAHYLQEQIVVPDAIADRLAEVLKCRRQ